MPGWSSKLPTAQPETSLPDHPGTGSAAFPERLNMPFSVCDKTETTPPGRPAGE